MKTLIIYDSKFGNTQKVAKAIAESLHTTAQHLEDVDPKTVSTQLLVIGSPTHGGRPTEAVSEFIQALNPQTVQSAASFDTRMDPQSVGKGLKLLMKLIGFAAPKMESDLKKKGIKPHYRSTGFIVEGKEGPLRKGELKRAASWLT